MRYLIFFGEYKHYICFCRLYCVLSPTIKRWLEGRPIFWTTCEPMVPKMVICNRLLVWGEFMFTKILLKWMSHEPEIELTGSLRLSNLGQKSLPSFKIFSCLTEFFIMQMYSSSEVQYTQNGDLCRFLWQQHSCKYCERKSYTLWQPPQTVFNAVWV